MTKKNNNKWYIVGGIAAVLLLILLWIGGSYNSLVRLDEQVDQSWGNVQTAYQRRTDLIPNLVSTVKAYTDYEGPLLEEITKARASIGSARTPTELAQADSSLSGSLSRLLVVAENYPNLKANEQFLDLQVQLEGTENRIKVERDNYNKAVRDLNTRIRKVPTNIIANAFGFEQKDYFEATQGSETAPKVEDLFEK